MKLPPTKNSQLEKRIKKLGFEKVREARHGAFYKRLGRDGMVYMVEIPRPPHKICPKGTMKSIIENSGYTVEEFFNKK